MRETSCQNNRNIYKSIIRKPSVDLLKSLILQNSNSKNTTNNKKQLYFTPHSFRGENALACKHTAYCAHLFLWSCYSIKARSRVLQVWWCSRGGGRPAGGEILHPPPRSHRNLLVPVAIHSRSKIQAVGLGSSSGG